MKGDDMRGTARGVRAGEDGAAMAGEAHAQEGRIARRPAPGRRGTCLLLALCSAVYAAVGVVDMVCYDASGATATALLAASAGGAS